MRLIAAFEGIKLWGKMGNKKLYAINFLGIPFPKSVNRFEKRLATMGYPTQSIVCQDKILISRDLLVV